MKVKLSIIKENKLNNKVIIILYKQENNQYSIFYGKYLESKKNYLDDSKKDTKYFEFEKEALIDFEEKKYFGQNVIFKSYNQDQEFMINLFDMLENGFKNNRWISLEDALKEISELLSFTEDKDAFENIMKGYLGEMCFIYYVMTSPLIDTQEKRLKYSKLLFEAFQKSRSEKYDFSLSSDVKFEIKSTSKEDYNFLIRLNQTQNYIDSINVYYSFVKYSFCQKKFGKNLKQIVELITEKLEIKDFKVPSHLLLSTSFNSWQNKYVYLDQIEVFMLNSKDLPRIATESYVKNITYDFDLIKYLNTNNINHHDWLYELETIMENIVWTNLQE